MVDSSIIFQSVLPVFAVIFCGLVVRRLGWLSREADGSIMTLIVNLLQPAFILSFIIGNEALREPANIVLPPFLGFCSIMFGFAFLSVIARFVLPDDQILRRSFAFVLAIHNYSYLTIPIVALLLGPEAMGLLFVYNLGIEIALWSFGVGFLLPGEMKTSRLRRIMNPPAIAIFVGLTVNFLFSKEAIPDFVLQTISLVGQPAIPLGLLIIGATFYDLVTTSNPLRDVRTTAICTVIRLAILPLSFLATAYFLPVSLELKQLIVIHSAMPCGVFPIVLVRRYGGSTDIALKAVIGSTIVSMLTIPIWISFGMRLVAS